MFHIKKVDFHQVHKNTVIYNYVVCSQMQYIKPSTQIRTYDAENVFKLLNLVKRSLLKFESKLPLKKLKSLQKGPEWFQSCLTYVDSLNVA